MIVFEKFGETIKIENNDWWVLRQRFDPKNAFKDGRYYYIGFECSLCAKYKKHDERGSVHCGDCPLAVKQLNCLGILNRIFKQRYFRLDNNGMIRWGKDESKQARRQLRRLQKMMDEIEELPQNQGVIK